MNKGKRAGDTPIGVDVLEGKSYFWCTCGLSVKQPFCDGSHKGTSSNGESTLYRFSNSFFMEELISKAFIDLFKLSSVICQKSLCLFIKLLSQVYSSCVVLQ